MHTKKMAVLLSILIIVTLSVGISTSEESVNQWKGRSYVVFDANYDYNDVGLPSFYGPTIEGAVNRAYDLLIARYTDDKYIDVQFGVFRYYNDEIDLTFWTNDNLQGSLEDKVYWYDYVFFIGHAYLFTIAETKYSTIPFYPEPTYYMYFTSNTSNQILGYPHGEIASEDYEFTIYTPKWYFIIGCQFLDFDDTLEAIDQAKMLFLNKVDPNTPVTKKEAMRMYLHGIVGFADPFYLNRDLNGFLEDFVGELAVYDDGHVIDANPIVKSWFDAACERTTSTPAALYPIVTIVAYKPGNDFPPTSSDLKPDGYYITITINYGNEGMYPFMNLYHTPKEMVNLLENLGYTIIDIDLRFVYKVGCDEDGL